VVAQASRPPKPKVGLNGSGHEGDDRQQLFTIRKTLLRVRRKEREFLLSRGEVETSQATEVGRGRSGAGKRFRAAIRRLKGGGQTGNSGGIGWVGH